MLLIVAQSNTNQPSRTRWTTKGAIYIPLPSKQTLRNHPQSKHCPLWSVPPLMSYYVRRKSKQIIKNASLKSTPQRWAELKTISSSKKSRIGSISPPKFKSTRNTEDFSRMRCSRRLLAVVHSLKTRARLSCKESRILAWAARMSSVYTCRRGELSQVCQTGRLARNRLTMWEEVALRILQKVGTEI